MSSAVPRPKRAAPMRKAPCAPASVQARRQAATILEVLAGVRRPSEAAAWAELGIGKSRFHKQRGDWLQEALALLEPRCAGRPSKQEPLVAPSEVQALRERMQEAEARAAAAEVQTELALVLPHVIHRPALGKKRSS